MSLRSNGCEHIFFLISTFFSAGCSRRASHPVITSFRCAKASARSLKRREAAATAVAARKPRKTRRWIDRFDTESAFALALRIHFWMATASCSCAKLRRRTRGRFAFSNIWIEKRTKSCVEKGASDEAWRIDTRGGENTQCEMKFLYPH